MSNVVVFPGNQTSAELVAFCKERGLYVQQTGVRLTIEQAEKRDKAVAYLRERNLYVIDKGTPAPAIGGGAIRTFPQRFVPNDAA